MARVAASSRRPRGSTSRAPRNRSLCGVRNGRRLVGRCLGASLRWRENRQRHHDGLDGPTVLAVSLPMSHSTKCWSWNHSNCRRHLGPPKRFAQRRVGALLMHVVPPPRPKTPHQAHTAPPTTPHTPARHRYTPASHPKTHSPRPLNNSHARSELASRLSPACRWLVRRGRGRRRRRGLRRRSSTTQRMWPLDQMPLGR